MLGGGPGEGRVEGQGGRERAGDGRERQGMAGGGRGMEENTSRALVSNSWLQLSYHDLFKHSKHLSTNTQSLTRATMANIMFMACSTI